MNRNRLLILAVAFALVGITVISLGIGKTVTLSINGQPTEIKTSAWTVSGLLREQEIALNEEDAINIPLSSWLTGGEEISIEKAAWINIHADGETISIYTRQRLPEKIISEAGIRLLDGDQILIDGNPTENDSLLSPGINHSLQILRAQTIELTVENQLETISSTAATLGEALWENGIDLKAGDRISPSVDTPLNKPLSAELESSQEITIQYAGGIIKSLTAAEIVSEALSESGIPLQALDYSKPGANTPIPKDGNIQVIRVQEDLILESDPIPYDTETQPVADLEIDNRKIVQPGVYGLNTKRVRVRYEDNLEVSRQVESEYISQEPQSEIVGYGTQIVPHTIDTPDGPIKYWRALNMYAVSYNVTSNGGYGTATGIPLAKGVVAIDPRYIPYGTRMYVPGYGEALAADTGGGVKGRMIDLGYLDENYVSWHQWVTVYFLWPPPENVVWIIP
ncbi:MAG: DUF348 domain-containing protein [Chloroflexi bacterium]|nr:DUF348 domain-containing protein [Chloroflexota bacterium]